MLSTMKDLFDFLVEYKIGFRTSGKNTRKGWVQICCPFCGDFDFHGGINIHRKYYNCWRCGYKSIWNLLGKLLGSELVPIVWRDFFKTGKKTKIIKDKEFKKVPFKIPGVLGRYLDCHKSYLRNRNFDIEYLWRKYDLYFTSHLHEDPWRIVIPIFCKDKIVSYQGRDISGKSHLRYKACPKEREIIHYKNLLYNMRNSRNDRVIVVEGITDVWRVGDDCVCTFGVGYTKEQLLLLASNYSTVFIMFDFEEEAQNRATKLGTELSSLGTEVHIVYLEEMEGKDPAELEEKIVLEIKKELFF